MTDNQNTALTLTNTTQRLSCQYPLSAVKVSNCENLLIVLTVKILFKDLSEFHPNNVYNNSWEYVKTNETDCLTDLECQNQYHDNGTVIAREYEARLSARKDETIRFHVKFSKGSHMQFTWMLEEDLGDTFPHVEEINERCMTKDSNDAALAGVFTGVPFESGPKNCTFPFRYADILYYACTNITTATGDGPYFVCATETDLDFNAVKFGECDMDNRCPSQCE